MTAPNDSLAQLIINQDYRNLAALSAGDYQVEEVVDRTIAYFSDPTHRMEGRDGDLEYKQFAESVHSASREQLIAAYQAALQIWQQGEP